VRFIKLFGIGMTLAVLMDAFVIRGTLVPAFMRLAGRANWWLPKFLEPLHARIEIREVQDVTPDETDDVAPAAVPAALKPRPVKARPARAKAPAPARKPAPRKTTTARKPAAKLKPAAKAKHKPSAPRRNEAR